MEKQIAVIWLGTQGYTEAIELSEVKRFEWEYLSMLKSSKTKILSEIRNKKEITPEIEKELKAFTEGFIKIFSQKSHESAQS